MQLLAVPGFPRLPRSPCREGPIRLGMLGSNVASPSWPVHYQHLVPPEVGRMKGRELETEAGLAE